MNRLTKLFICMITASMFALLPVNIVWSADEDIGSSVYLVFDPATGEFVTEVDPDIVKQDKLDYELGRSSGTETTSSAGNQAKTQGTAATPAQSGQTSSVNTDSSSSGMSPLLLGGIVGVILLGGIVVLVKRNQQKLST